MNKPFSKFASIIATAALIATGVAAVTAVAQTPLEIVKNREGEMKKLGGI